MELHNNITKWKMFTPFLLIHLFTLKSNGSMRKGVNAHSGAFSSAKSNGSMRIEYAQRCIPDTSVIYTINVFDDGITNTTKTSGSNVARQNRTGKPSRYRNDDSNHI